MDVASYTRNPSPWINNKILLLEPDEVIQMLYRDELAEEGYEVIPVGKPGQEMELIETLQPGLMIMEAGLYGYNGLGLLQEIRKAYPELPVILCTSDPSFRTEPMALAADDVVLKGMTVSELKQSVKNVLGFRSLINTGGDPSTREITSNFV